MSTFTTSVPSTVQTVAGGRTIRISAGFGLVYAIAQLIVMIGFSVFVLPKGGSVGEDPLHWGDDVLAAATWYRVGNYLLMLAGMLLLGFLGAVHARLRRADPSGVLATIAVGAGILLSLLWPLAAALHNVALDIAETGADVRMLAGWDSVAPYLLALSALPRLFLIAAIVAGMRRAGETPWLRRIGIVLLPASLFGSATLLTGAVFPLLALGTLATELWIGAVAVRWMRAPR